MISAVELARYLYGAWRLVKRDATGFDAFENTPAAAWRSFQVFVIALPIVAFLYVDILSTADIEADFLTVVWVTGAIYVIRCTAFPLLLVYLAPQFDFERNLYRTIGAWNWSVLLQILPALFLAAISLAIGPLAVLELLKLCVFVAILVYVWFILRHGLEVDNGLATALVVFDAVFSFMLSFVWRGLL